MSSRPRATIKRKISNSDSNHDHDNKQSINNKIQQTSNKTNSNSIKSNKKTKQSHDKENNKSKSKKTASNSSSSSSGPDTRVLTDLKLANGEMIKFLSKFNIYSVSELAKQDGHKLWVESHTIHNEFPCIFTLDYLNCIIAQAKNRNLPPEQTKFNFYSRLRKEQGLLYPMKPFGPPCIYSCCKAGGPIFGPDTATKKKSSSTKKK